MIGNKIADRTTKATKLSSPNSSETFTNETENIRLGIEIPKERYTNGIQQNTKKIIFF